MRRGGPGAEHQRNRATPRNSAHDLRRHRRSIRAGHCAAVDRAPGIRRSAARCRDPRRRLSDTNSFKKKLLHSFDLAQGSPDSGSPAALGRAGTPLAHLHAPGHLRRLVARRARRGARRFIRRVLRRRGIAAGAALDSVRGLCALAAALAVTSGHRCAARILARAASRSVARDAACQAAGPRRTIDDFRTARRSVDVAGEPCRKPPNASAMREGGTLFMALVAALKTLLHRYLGQDDVRVATQRRQSQSSGDRGAHRPAGQYGDSPHQPRWRPQCSGGDASGSGDHPRSLRPPGSSFRRARRDPRARALSQPPALSDVMITLHNASLRPIIGCHTLTFEEANPGMLAPLVTITPFDVIFMLHESAQGLRGHCVYKPHLFGARTIDRLLRDFQKVLEQMVTQPERPISTIRISHNPSQPQRRALPFFDAERAT